MNLATRNSCLGKRLVDAPHQPGSALAVGADDDAVGMEKLNDGRAFAQEFGVGDDIVALGGDAVEVKHAANPLAGMDRDGTLFDNDFVAVDGTGNLRDHSLDVREVGGAGIALGRADGDEDSLALLDGCCQIGGEGDTAPSMASEKLGQMALEDGHAAIAEGLHFGFVLVHAEDLVADLGKTDSSYESDVSGPDHTDGNWLRHTLALFLADSRPLSGIAPGDGASRGAVQGAFVNPKITRSFADSLLE